jgi:diaminohydroxyphosphoribosylaminopyrimidine deaminase/5-amino-6-(5-phosphoribosylamino)uracil reductase
MEPFDSVHTYYMRRCLELAQQGRATVSPNPMVGAVVLDRKGRKVAEAYHKRAGEAHAEVLALDIAGEAARGGTLYVNLEPCSHHGRTPPCTDLIIQSGIDKVIFGTLDPNPQVSGNGRDLLQNARISVRHGFLESACLRLNEVFFYTVGGGGKAGADKPSDRPFVSLKVASSLDGKMATRGGDSQWLTNKYARQYVHHLRSYHDAILTTAKTVAADDAQLTVRDIPTPFIPPVRIVIDRHFRLAPHQYRIFDIQAAPTWVITSHIQHNRRHAQEARAKGVNVVEMPETGQGMDLSLLMRRIYDEGLHSVMVEGGGQLAGSLLAEKLVNKVYWFTAGKVFNDTQAVGAGGAQVTWTLGDAITVRPTQFRQIGDNFLVEGDVVSTKPLVKAR